MTCVPATQPSAVERIGILLTIAVISAVAWLLLVIGAPGGRGAGWALATALWFVMMVGMMLPSVAPWFVVFAGTSRNTPAGMNRVARLAGFGVGYGFAWLGFSVAAGAAQVALASSGAVDLLRVGSGVGGTFLLIGAGIYQFTSAKAACLRHCRSPIGYFLTAWRPGTLGAVRLGLGHGLFCLGCCWALMALAFGLGVMHLGWMAVLAVVVAAEKLLPRGVLVSRVIGAGLVVWGVFVW